MDLSARDADDLIATIPYCRHLGIRAQLRDGMPILYMPFEQKLIGNVTLPALHGGVIGSLLETAAIVQAAWEAKSGALPKPVDITIDYLRTAGAVQSFARARIAKLGRRILNVHAEMWQEDETKPVAALRGHFLVSPTKSAML